MLVRAPAPPWDLGPLGPWPVDPATAPYGREHTNPEAPREPEWDSPRPHELVCRARKDCHSNQTTRPWYSFVAPTSWLVQRDVEEGRSHFNVSEWGGEGNHADEAAKLVREGEMPLWFYLPRHSEAQLTDSERQELVAGPTATFGEPRALQGDEHLPAGRQAGARRSGGRGRARIVLHDQILAGRRKRSQNTRHSASYRLRTPGSIVTKLIYQCGHPRLDGAVYLPPMKPRLFAQEK